MIILIIFIIIHFINEYNKSDIKKDQLNNEPPPQNWVDNLFFIAGAFFIPIGLGWFSYDIFHFLKGEKDFTSNEGDQDYIYTNSTFAIGCVLLFQISSLLFLLNFYKKRGRSIANMVTLTIISLIVFFIIYIGIDFDKASSSHQWR